VRAHFVEAALASNLVPVPAGGGRFETGLYGIPEQTNCLVLLRNRALFRRREAALRAAGLDPERAPATWTELIEYGRNLSEPEAGFHAFGMKNTLWWSLPFLFSGGGTLFEAHPEKVYTCALGTPAAEMSYRYWVDLTRRPHPGPGGPVTVEGGFWKGEADEQKAFLEGRLAMSMSGPWNVPLYRTRVPELAASLLPAGPAGSISTVGGSNLVVMPTCVDRQAALAFLAFVGSDEYQLEWALELGQIPVTKGALDQATEKADSILRVFMQQMRTARARPTLPNFQPVENIFQAEMELALRGGRSPEEGLRQAVAKIEAEVLGPVRDSL
jgi:multiple sugar transport system substrate-binding protein